MKYVINAVRILFLALFIFLVMTGRVRMWLIIFAASLAAALFSGRIYCGYVCPMNTLMIPTEWISKTEILRQYFINHPQSIDKYTFLQNSAFTHWVKEKCSKMC